nr:ubiquitin-specific protease 13 [Tanacetum cinerariifolium]
MAKRDEMATRKLRSKVDSSSNQVADVNDGGLPKDKKNYKKSSKVNEVLQPKPSPNTKSFVRRLPKEVSKEKGPVKPKAARVESNVGKRKRLVNDKEVEDERDFDVDGSDEESDYDKEHKVSKEVDVSNETEEEGKGVKTKVFKCKEKVVVSKFKKRSKEVEDKRDTDVEDNDGESDYDKDYKGSEEAGLSNESKEEEARVEGNESKEDNESAEDRETKVSKESDDSKPRVKDVKMKGVKGNKTVVVSKAKKRMHVFDSSSKEEKVSKLKKVSKKNMQVNDVKKRKHVSDSSSSYDESSSSEEEKVSKPKKVYKNKKQVKDLKKKQVNDESSSSEDEKPLKNKKLPSLLFASIRDSQVDMESFLSDIGFSSFHIVFIDTLPHRFAKFVVRGFSASSYEFKLEKGIIRVTLKKVHEILGVPLNGTSIFDLPERPLDDPFVKEWFKQFDPKTLKEIRACDIAKKPVLAKTADFMFKVNFFMLFANVMSTADTMKAIVNLTVLRRIHKDTNIARIAFQVYIHDFYNNDDDKGGKHDNHGSDNVGKKKESAGKDIMNDKKYGMNGEKDGVDAVQEGEADGFYSTIEDKFSIIFVEKIALVDLFKRVNAEFPNEGKVIELYEKYRILFKESVFVEAFQVYIHDFYNNDDDKGGKHDNHGSDNVGKKKESAGKDIMNDKKYGVNGEKDGVDAVQEGEADVNKEPEHMLEEETFTQWIEKNID